jgi:hypothetical protein
MTNAGLVAKDEILLRVEGIAMELQTESAMNGKRGH